MNRTRRQFVAAASTALATGALGIPLRANAQTTELKISHQFPGGTLTEGDFRDRLSRRFAAEVEKETKGALKMQVYPGSSLMKVNAQFAALRRGALDLSLFPLSYAGGEVPETNIGLMPGLVTSYEQAYSWKTAEVGKLLSQVMADKGVVIVTWIWQAGGTASRGKPIVVPEDAKGLKVRGGSREMDMILKEAGASVITLPSNEIYAGMQTGAMDAAMTSSTSLMSFRLEEVSKALTTGKRWNYWFMFEPLIMSKIVFDKLPKPQQDAIMGVGAQMEKFALESAKADDVAVAEVYRKKGATVTDLDEAAVKKWQAIARNTAWKDYGAKSETSAKLLAAAIKTL